MATSEILQYAGSSGANVISQADYAALTSTRSNGMSSGIVQSALFNKILRQSSFIAAGLAKALSDLGVNVPDDGNLAALAANLNVALGGRPGHTFTANDWNYEDGLIKQWGYMPTGTTAAGSALIPLPRSFPNSFLYGDANSANGGATPTVVSLGPATTNSALSVVWTAGTTGIFYTCTGY